MERNNSENIYEVGTVVYAKVNSSLKLRVRRYIDRIYYCTVLDDPAVKEQVYFERELAN